ncbi:hypothetical protein BYT27DRAFT_7192894 [Phlegmacium glaucopus]|nr:hypothetical protein BYT27DRAFT_7192894 [Phlegmacium glaucopus]
MSLLICSIKHGGVVHNPLGAGSYVFKDHFIPHFLQYCKGKTLISQFGAQPNSSPHIGTIATFSVAFAIASRVQDRDVLISLDIVDTAPSEQVNIDGTIYQKKMDSYMEDYKVVMASLHKYWGVRYRIRTQTEFLNDPKVVVAVKKILDQRQELQRSLAPKHRCLGIRSMCPVDECVDISDIEAVAKLEFNTPLRNLLRAMVFASDESSDYSGYYQEQLLWRHIPQSPIIIYAPQILDWSGVKISKSLYVCEGGYDYLRLQGLEYCLSFKKFQAEGKDLDVLFKEVDSWVDNPSKLFRSYSLKYIHALFERAGRCDEAVVV